MVRPGPFVLPRAIEGRTYDIKESNFGRASPCWLRAAFPPHHETRLGLMAGQLRRTRRCISLVVLALYAGRRSPNALCMPHSRFVSLTAGNVRKTSAALDPPDTRAHSTTMPFNCRYVPLGERRDERIQLRCHRLNENRNSSAIYAPEAFLSQGGWPSLAIDAPPEGLSR